MPIHKRLIYPISALTSNFNPRNTNDLKMRIKKEHTDVLKQLIRQHLPDAEVYLFGSRVDDQRKGGDTDILVIGERVLSYKERRNILIAFKKQFGPQKIDIVSFSKTDRSAFKELALLEAKPL